MRLEHDAHTSKLYKEDFEAMRDFADDLQQKHDQLKRLVQRQLQWQNHLRSVHRPMSIGELMWIEDAEIALGGDYGKTPNVELTGAGTASVLNAKLGAARPGED